MVHQLMIYDTPAARHAICQTTSFNMPSYTFRNTKRYLSVFQTYTIRYEHEPYAQRTTNAERMYFSRETGVTQLWYGRYPNVVRTLPEQDRMITRTR